MGLALGIALTGLARTILHNASAWYVSIAVLAINHLCVYLIPSLVYWYWFEACGWKDFNSRSIKKVSSLWIAIIVGTVLLPFNQILIVWNKGIKLSGVFSGIEQWMIQKEQANSLLTERLFNIDSIHQLILLIIVSALIASLGEEVFFRGIIQNKLIQGKRSIHVGVWLTAALFSAVHIQFYGFFPRLVLGALFGYLYVFSGNIWIAILSHFLNNSLYILTIFFGHRIAKSDVGMNFEFGRWIYGSFSLILSILLLTYFYRRNSSLYFKKLD